MKGARRRREPGEGHTLGLAHGHHGHVSAGVSTEARRLGGCRAMWGMAWILLSRRRSGEGKEDDLSSARLRHPKPYG